MGLELLTLVNNFQATAYDINLSISHQKSNFTGLVKISLKKDSKPVPSKPEFEFLLNSSELVITSAVFKTTESIEHKAKVSYDRPIEIVKLTTPDSTLYNEENLTLILKYIGKVNTIKTYRDQTKGIFKTNYLDDRTNKATNYIIATHSQASFARTIFPSIDEPVSKALYRLNIETNANFKVISNTSPESKVINGELQKVQFKETPLISTSIFGFVIGDLDFIESKVILQNQEIVLRFYTAIGSNQGSAYAFDVAKKSLPLIEKTFGSDFPLDKLDIVALPFLSDGAMENHGLITIQAGHVLIESLTNRQATQSIRQLVVHEIIHHWVGNNVSFDGWEHLWLNEAFATWFAYYILFQLDLDSLDREIWNVQADQELEKLLVQDGATTSKPIVSSYNTERSVKSTQDAFQVSSYEKGIQFLRMFANTFESGKFDNELSKFVETLKKVIKIFQHQAIKPNDLWKVFHDDSKIDFFGFTHSWTKLPGFPILSVSLSDEKKVVIEQHRFFEDSSVEEEQDEDVPYHVPLAIRLSDSSVINTIMHDRRLVLEGIKLEEFVKLNSNRIGIYRVQYQDEVFYDNIVKNYEKLTSSDVLGLVHDLTKTLAHKAFHSDVSVVGFLKLSRAILLQKDVNFNIASHVLNTLQVLENSYKLYSSNDKHKVFAEWLKSLNKQLFDKFEWTHDYSKASPAEIDTRRSILNIGIETPEVAKVADFLFKRLLHGPSRSVPAQLLEPVLSTTALNANQTTWKKILELVKQPAGTANHIYGGSSSDIQNASIASLGFTRDPNLVKRVLNFVSNNIDSSLVELALVGLQFNHETNKQALWDWFKLNYNNWAVKSSRPGSDSAARLKKTLKGITYIVFSGLTTEEDNKLVEKFVEDKLKNLPEHSLTETLKLVKESQDEKAKTASSIVSVLKFTQ